MINNYKICCQCRSKNKKKWKGIRQLNFIFHEMDKLCDTTFAFNVKLFCIFETHRCWYGLLLVWLYDEPAFCFFNSKRWHHIAFVKCFACCLFRTLFLLVVFCCFYSAFFVFLFLSQNSRMETHTQSVIIK